MPSSLKILRRMEVREMFTLTPRDCFSSVVSEKDNGGVAGDTETAEGVLAEAYRQAERVIRDAEQKAAELLEQARRRAEEEAAALAEKVRQEAYREAMEKAEREAEVLRAQAREVLKQAEEIRRVTFERLEGELVDLAVSIAEKVVGMHLSVDPEAVLAVAREAIQMTGVREQVTIWAHPDEVALFNEKMDELRTLLPASAALNVIADPAVKPGGCRVETEHGRVDATLDARWKALLEALYSER